MPHIVNDNCRLCLFTECVEHCPVRCFHTDGERVYIDPDTCIDCSACIPPCPVQAISEVVDHSEDEARWLATNRAKSHELPVIASKRAPLPTAAARQAQLGF